jgi:SAM-dependent methyltransferase
VDEPAWRLFERVADEYDQVLPFFQVYGASIVGAIEPGPGCRFLDLGAGRGALTAAALARGCVVTAVDAAPAMMARLAAQHAAVAACVMDAEALGFADGTFDVVAASFVMHLLADPGRAAGEAHRVLAPDGVFALTGRTRPAGDLSMHLDALFAEFAPFQPPGSELGRPLVAPDLLAAAGFTHIQEVEAAVTVAVPDTSTLWRWLMSHGYRAFVEALPGDRRDQFQGRVRDLPVHDGALRRIATVWSGRR